MKPLPGNFACLIKGKVPKKRSGGHRFKPGMCEASEVGCRRERKKTVPSKKGRQVGGKDGRRRGHPSCPGRKIRRGNKIVIHFKKGNREEMGRRNLERNTGFYNRLGEVIFTSQWGGRA